MLARLRALVSRPTRVSATPRGIRNTTRAAFLAAVASISGCGFEELSQPFQEVTARRGDAAMQDGSSPSDVPNDTVSPTDATDAQMVTDSADVTPVTDTGNDTGVVTDATDAGMSTDVPVDTGTDTGMTPTDVPGDTGTDSGTDAGTDVTPVDAGAPCVPTSVVVGNDNVIVAAHGNNVPVVVNFTGSCPTLGTDSVQARLTYSGIGFPAVFVAMNSLEGARARGTLNLADFTGFPMNTYSSRDGTDSPVTGNMYPTMRTMPVDFVVDRVPPVMTALTAPSFDRGSMMYQFAFTGDSDGRVVVDVRTTSDAGIPRTLLSHGTGSPCTLSRGTVPGRSVSTGCSADSTGAPQSCVPLGGVLQCESDRLIFPVSAMVRTVHTLASQDYHAVVDTVAPGTIMSFVLTYVDHRGNAQPVTRSISL